MKKAENHGEADTRRPDGTAVQIILAVLSILLGLLLLFVPQVQVVTLCYVFCGALIAVGVVFIVAFFLSEGYKRLHNYNFALGVLLIILGCCGLLRVDELAERFELYMGLVALVLAVVILQNAVQLRVLQNPLWMVELILTALSMIGAILVLADVRPVLDRVEGLTYWIVLIVGGLSLIGLCLASIVLFHEKRRIQKLEKAETDAQAAAEEEPEDAP